MTADNNDGVHLGRESATSGKPPWSGRYSSGSIPPLEVPITLQADQSWVSPSSDAQVPVQRWFLYPHSFSKSLVSYLIEQLAVIPSDRVGDPFLGAGSTFVACLEREIPADGLDLLPLSVFVSRTKVYPFNRPQLEACWADLQRTIDLPQIHVTIDSPFHTKYFSEPVLSELNRLRLRIESVQSPHRDFFLLALIRNIFKSSRMKRDGGWLRWKKKDLYQPDDVLTDFSCTVGAMLSDVPEQDNRLELGYIATEADARLADLPCPPYRLIVTSPPYLNRHDYTRLLSLELLVGLESSQHRLRDLRYQSLRSHVEAKSPVSLPAIPGFRSPALISAESQLKDADSERRIRTMVTGYFADMHHVIYRSAQALSSHGYLALVVSDARFHGVIVPVAEILKDVAAASGLRSVGEQRLRWRGNSSQQMARYGKVPVGEWLLLWQKP